MNLIDAARVGLTSKYADFSGRARRSEYWWFSVVYVVGVALVAALVAILDAPMIWIAAILVVIPMLSVSVRRFHDRGRSGWGILVNLIPLVGTIIYLTGMARRGTSGTNRFGPPPA